MKKIGNTFEYGTITCITQEQAGTYGGTLENGLRHGIGMELMALFLLMTPITPVGRSASQLQLWRHRLSEGTCGCLFDANVMLVEDFLVHRMGFELLPL